MTGLWQEVRRQLAAPVRDRKATKATAKFVVFAAVAFKVVEWLVTQ